MADEIVDYFVQLTVAMYVFSTSASVPTIIQIKIVPF